MAYRPLPDALPEKSDASSSLALKSGVPLYQAPKSALPLNQVAIISHKYFIDLLRVFVVGRVSKR